MIPILYKAKETNFTHNGIGSLAEAVSCVATENRNGAFELTLEYPLSGRLYSYIQEDCIIKAKTNDTSTPQLFRIYKSSKPINGRVSFYAEHISYLLSGIPIEAIEIKNANAQTAISNVLAAGILEHEFTAQSDIETLNSISLSLLSVRAALGGVQGSILDTYGGEYEFDNFVVKLHAHRGRDTGIKIAYGKNLTDFKQEKSISEVYTAVFPYVRYTPQSEDDTESEEITVTLSEKIIYSPYIDNYAHVRVLMKDFSDTFKEDEKITEANLRSKAQSWVDTSGFDIPTVNITVTFKNIWKSPEYAEYALLERVSLCDTAVVEFEKLGISAKAKVIKTVYDVLKEQYNSVELGNVRANFADTINQNTSATEEAKHEIKKQATAASAKVATATAKATAAITATEEAKAAAAAAPRAFTFVYDESGAADAANKALSSEYLEYNGTAACYVKVGLMMMSADVRKSGKSISLFAPAPENNVYYRIVISEDACTYETGAKYDSVINKTSANAPSSAAVAEYVEDVVSSYATEHIPGLSNTGTALGSAEDLNNKTEPGIYVQYLSEHASADKHYPCTMTGFLEVVGSPEGHILQRYTEFDCNRLYIRCLYDGAWGIWKTISLS